MKKTLAYACILLSLSMMLQYNSIQENRLMSDNKIVTLDSSYSSIISDIKPPTKEERLHILASRGEIRSRVMEVTAYSVTYEDCGKIDGITASGDEIHEGVVASDPSIPFGTRLWIEGIGEVVVKDRGGAIHGDILDLYISDPKEAEKFGRQKRKVFFLGK